LSKKDYHPTRRKGTALGVDLGATLAKLALREKEGRNRFELLPADALAQIEARIERWRPERIGLTGAGAGELARRLAGRVTAVDEFRAWHAGAEALLEKEGLSRTGRYLLVSLGTGTSVLLADGARIARVGGTALGGGTLLGLGASLLGTISFQELTSLAKRGRREQVDLSVGDIDRDGWVPLPRAVTASNFGKVPRQLREGKGIAREDLAGGLVGLVGENVALICAALAAREGVIRIVLAGSTLRGNPALHEVLGAVLRALDREPLFLPSGEFAGSLGALLLAGGR
jgi:type II pantothenate kinase